MTSRPPANTRANALATRLLFLIVGIACAAWASLVPLAKERTGLDEGALGLLLLCLGAGSIMAMPLSGMVATRLGCRFVLALCTAVICATLPLLAFVSSPLALALVLFVFGAAIGAADCVMNVQAVIVERDSARSMMSGFHGFFSVGGILGATSASSLMTLGASPLATTLATVALIVLLIATAYTGLLPYGGRKEGPAFAIPHGVVLFLGVLALIVFLAEGAMLDWSAVFLVQERGMQSVQAGFGYAVFALTMTAGRLAGDTLVGRVGPRTIVTLGGALAAFGIALSTIVPIWQVALLGYALVGLGCSNIVPVLFTATGRQKTMPEAVAVPAISTLGYAGVLAGPAAIGFIAHHSSLPIAFLVVALLMVGVSGSGRLLRV